MNYEVKKDFPDDIIYEKEGPCISLYQTTHRHSPDNKQDSIVFKNLMREIEESLNQKYDEEKTISLLEPFNKIKDDKMFWNQGLDSLAILANPDKCAVYRLESPVKSYVSVSNSFHIVPLIRAYQSSDKYHILGLSRGEFSMYEGDRYGVRKIQMVSTVLTTAEQVLGEELSESHLTQGSFSSGRESVKYHGRGGGKDEMDRDTEKFFRYVDEYVFENYSNVSHLPLILVALAENCSLFKELSNNPYLTDDSITIDYASMEIEQLREKAWKIIEPVYLNKTKKVVDDFLESRSNLMGSEFLTDVAKAAYENRVKMLLIEDDRAIWGKLDYDIDKLVYGDVHNPDYDDILDYISKMVLVAGGEVIVLPKENMPCSTGLAAVFR